MPDASERQPHSCFKIISVVYKNAPLALNGVIGRPVGQSKVRSITE